MLTGVLERSHGSSLLIAVLRRRPGGVAGLKLRAAAFLAFHTLPQPLRELYGIDHGHREQQQVQALCAAIRWGRVAVPEKTRLISPAMVAAARMRGEPGRVSETAVLARRGWHGPDAT